MANYQSQYTGTQIDTAIGKVDEKLDKTGGTLSGNLLPQSYDTYTLGSSAYPFNSVYAKNGVFASLIPDNISSEIGSSSNPFYRAYFTHMLASNGNFTNLIVSNGNFTTNLMVSGQNVWSNAGITTQSVVVSGGSTGNSYTITLYKIGRLVVVNAAPWMDFGTIAANTVIGTLPSGWRPAANTYGAFIDPLHAATIKFLANGNISTNSETSRQYCGFLCGTAYMTP